MCLQAVVVGIGWRIKTLYRLSSKSDMESYEESYAESHTRVRTVRPSLAVKKNHNINSEIIKHPVCCWHIHKPFCSPLLFLLKVTKSVAFVFGRTALIQAKINLNVENCQKNAFVEISWLNLTLVTCPKNQYRFHVFTEATFWSQFTTKYQQLESNQVILLLL
jgi:hypothetical protein